MDPRLVRLVVNSGDLMQRIDTAATGHGPPDEETVHRLRTGTRRCGALLASLLQHAGRNPLKTEEKAARKLLRQWKILRRAAGSARDMDVHLKLLQDLRKPLLKFPPAAIPQTPGVAEQLEQLATWLTVQRAARAHKLKEVAARRCEKCRSLTLRVLGGLKIEEGKAEAQGPATRNAPALLALEDFYAVSQMNALLNRDNLHDFRKSTKEARYVAEAGGGQEHAVAVSKALKRIQDAVGDWHDLDSLCLEARQALGNEGTELSARLEDLADSKLRQAIVEAEKMRRRLLGERLAWQPKRRRAATPVSSNAAGRT